MFDRVTITYRGAKYEIGRGRDFYGIWISGAPRSQPLEWWPETDEGWSAAWTRFACIEAPGTIVPVGRRTPPVPQAAPVAEGTVPVAEVTGPAAEDTGPPAGPYGRTAETAAQRVAPMITGRTGAVVSAALLAGGVILGIAGLFPAYLAGSSLAQQAVQLVPHAIYLATWTASAALILSGGARLRLGALLAVGMSLVTFGLYFADAGMAISGGPNAAGAGLVLTLLGWLACAAGSAMAFLLRPAGGQDAPGSRGWLRRPRGAGLGPVIMVVLAGLGVAAAFAPSWDSYTLRNAAGQSESLTAGNAFANPGLVIAGDVAVMIAFAAVVIVAALWRPVRHGAVLLAGAIIPMAALAISALVQIGEPASPTQFGFTPAQATQVGLTISAGLTPAFWIYFGFLIVLVVSCSWMLFTPQPASGPGTIRDPYTWNPVTVPDDDDDDEDSVDDETDSVLTPDFETTPPAARPRESDHPADS